MINDLIMTGWDWRSFSHRRPWREGQIRWCEKCEMMVSRVIMMDTSVNIHFNASSKLTTVFTAVIFPPLSSQLSASLFLSNSSISGFYYSPWQGLVATSPTTHWVCVFGGMIWKMLTTEGSLMWLFVQFPITMTGRITVGQDTDSQ